MDERFLYEEYDFLFMDNCDVKKVREKLEKMNYGEIACETRLAGQNYFVILDKNNFARCDSRNFQFYIPKKIIASSTPRFLLGTLII